MEILIDRSVTFRLWPVQIKSNGNMRLRSFGELGRMRPDTAGNTAAGVCLLSTPGFLNFVTDIASGYDGNDRMRAPLTYASWK